MNYYRFPLSLFSIFFLLFNTSYAGEGFSWLNAPSAYFGIPAYILTFALVFVVIVAIAIVYRLQLEKVADPVIPDKGLSIRNILDSYGEFILEQCRTVIGPEHATEYFPFFSILFLVILLANLIGLIPGFLPPTEYMNVTFALGLFSFLYYNFHGIRKVGFLNYMKHFAGPLWYLSVLIFPVEILSNLIRPFSLGLRLKGNMSGDHIVLSVFSELVPLGVPLIFMALGILVSFIQAYVFTVLSMVYVGLAVAHHDHDDGH